MCSSSGECGFDVLTLDATAEWATVRTELPPVTLQGAYDPKLLVDGTEAEVVAATNEMLDALGGLRLQHLTLYRNALTSAANYPDALLHQQQNLC